MPKKAAHEKIKLTIELVPSTAWLKNLRSELSPQDWDRIRKYTYSKAGNVCEVCGGRGPKWPVECHEIWHYDDKDKIQKLLGTVALCPDCHKVKHFGYASISGNKELAYAQLKKVNKWTNAQANRYVSKVFKIWKARSKHEWTLDLSWLDSILHLL